MTAEPLFAQTTIYVDANSTDPTHDGSSWCDAYDKLDEALGVASSGDTIKVADGEYSPDPPAQGDPRDATFQLKNGVTILGGYAGCGAPNPDDRDVQQYESKLTGDLNGDDEPDGTASASSTCTSFGGSWSDDVCDSVDANGNRPTSQSACDAIGGGATWYPALCSMIAQDKRDDNVYHVLTADSTVLSGVLDGLTITRGNAQTRRCYDTNSLVCTVDFCVRDQDCASGQKCGKCCKDGTNDNNFCVDGEDCPDPGVCFGFPRNDGAGLFNRGGTLTINNCTFTVNYADFRGGGLMNLTDQEGNGGDLTLTNTDFLCNHVIDNGGGLYNGADTVMDPTTCNFVGNESNISGGGVCNRQTAGTWINCKFIGNYAGGGEGNGGGGMFNASSSPTLTNCEFFKNGAPGGGGGMWNERDDQDPTAPPSSPVLTACDFVDNAAGSTTHTGGGAIWNQNRSSPVISSCTFRGNTAGGHYGGAIWNEGSGTNPVISSCTFVRNKDAGGGGAIFAHLGAIPVIVDSIFVDNQALGGFAGGGGGINTHAGGSVEVISSIFVGNQGGAEGGGLDADVGIDVKVSNSLFVGNDAGTGGGIGEESGGLTVTNCTVVDNEAFGSGGGIGDRDFQEPDPSIAIIVNSIFWGNKDSTGTGEDAQIFNIPADNVTYTDWDGHGLDATRNNLDEDPLFAILLTGDWSAAAVYNADTHQTTFTDTGQSWTVDEWQDEILNPDTTQMRQSVVVSNTANTIVVWGDFSSLGGSGVDYRIKDYHVPECSPVIDAGNDAAMDGVTCASTSDCTDVGLNVNCDVMSGICDADLDQNTRSFDSGDLCKDGSIVDMGAYEYQETVDEETCGCDHCGVGWCCNSSECSGDQVCCENACVECCDDGDCSSPEPYCKVSNHTCVGCLNDFQCGSGELCCNNVCESWECCDDSDCPGFGHPYCRLSDHTCICLTDADCGFGTCLSGSCCFGPACRQQGPQPGP